MSSVLNGLVESKTKWLLVAGLVVVGSIAVWAISKSCFRSSQDDFGPAAAIGVEVVENITDIPETEKAAARHANIMLGVNAT